MEMVLKDLIPAVYRPEDGVNNGDDRLGKVAESTAMAEQLRSWFLIFDFWLLFIDFYL